MKRVHEGRKNHKCIICEKFFFTSYHLKRHFRVHEGRKQHLKFVHKNFEFEKTCSNQKNNKDSSSLIQIGKKTKLCENLPLENEIKKEKIENDEEMPTFESDSNYLKKDIKAEIQFDLELILKTEDDVDLDEIPIFGIDS